MTHPLLPALLALVLAGASGVSPWSRAQTPPVETGYHYDTFTLIEDTIKGLPKCLKYCLLGFEIRIRYVGYAVEIYVVPHVEHHLAAVHVMTSDRFPKEAYTEWAGLVGEIQKQLLDRLAQTVPPALGGTALRESSGGQTRYGEYGSHQATNFKEAEHMGHPVAYLSVLLDKNGNMSKDTYTEGDTGGGGFDGGTDLAGFLGGWGRWSAGCFSDPNACAGPPGFPTGLVGEVFKIKDYLDTIINAVKASGVDFNGISKTLYSIGNKIADNVGAGGGVKIDRLLCPNDVTYFYPYYLSGVDALFWRSGAPVTDMTHLSTMINPFSSDRIGPDGATWAHVYPRHGFVNNDHPGHVAPVAAYRSADLVADGGVRLRPKRTTVYARGDWQTLAPQPTAFCAAAIGDLPTPIDPEGGYAHNIWPRFECPLSEIGILVAFIPYRYCFTW